LHLVPCKALGFARRAASPPGASLHLVPCKALGFARRATSPPEASLHLVPCKALGFARRGIVRRDYSASRLIQPRVSPAARGTTTSSPNGRSWGMGLATRSSVRLPRLGSRP